MNYWEQRSIDLALEQENKGKEYYSGKMQRQFSKAWSDIQDDINRFYQRFADNNGIMDFAEAKRLLNSDELKEFHMNVEDFIRLAKDNPDGEYTKMLNNVSYKVRVSRLQELQIQVESAVQQLNMELNNSMHELFATVYEDTYYRTIFNVQQGVGIGVNFAKIDQKQLQSVLSQPWVPDKRTFSQRIWGNNAKLTNELSTVLSQGIIRGLDATQVAKELSARMDVSMSNALRLVQTENNHFANEASFEGYKAAKAVKKYQFLATLDSHTSPKCRHMDNKIFVLSDKQSGVNFPPLHSRCRSTTIPYFDDSMISVGERIARGADGKTYNVPADMSYEQWYKKYVKGD